MLTLTGENIYLRALEPDDLEFVHAIENDETIWEFSNTQTPYSKFLVKQYLENSHQDIYEAKQLRLAICLKATFDAIGLIDLFDFDARNQRAGVGIIIKDMAERGNGYGSQALEQLLHYSFIQLGLHQLYANIDPANVNSVALFTKFGFVEIGVKKQWNRVRGEFRDETMFQLVRK
ncbi:MAG: N-acetyltransferase [Flavobacterium sp.]|uniref:GNAT family N-acetyltransferase n=1 Tax=Flavobacterium sp. TaxID=239 RepID=UPI00122B3F07|nr:GNAT family N-acetyltransferase [Flavobacterium sp.]RZJ64165.1 MAG: N-acetyltransferase [Flavobacterium sp.]